MWNLSINLPLIIGDKIPCGDENWECFLLLIDILKLCTAKIASTAHAGILEAMIHDHHHLFTHCYPTTSVIPKMHYMVHFPHQIIRYAINFITLFVVGDTVIIPITELKCGTNFVAIIISCII